jgi:HEAT repeat protein
VLLTPLRPTFEAALRDVTAKGPRFRVDAATRLGDPPESQLADALTGLRALLRDESPEVRRAALVSIGLIGEPADAALARVAVGDAHPEVRRTALAALHALVLDEALADVRMAITSPCESLRAEAVALLASSEQPEDIERLAGRLRDENADVRAVAALALSRSNDARVTPALIALLRTSYGLDAAVSLGRVPIAGHEDPIARVASGLFTSAHVRVACAAALARAGDQRGIRILREALLRRFSPARAYALELIGLHTLTALVDVVRVLRGRPRGLDPEVIEHVLARLDASTAPAPHSA